MNVLLTIMLSLPLASCGLLRNRAADLPVVTADAQGLDYRIVAGDLLRVHYPLAPQFNDDLRVRPDGCIAPRLAGEVAAVGLTADNLAATIEARQTASRGADSNAVVSVLEPSGAYVSVGGEVRWPQRLPFRNAPTADQAIRAAGGILFSGDGANAVLLRQGGDRPSAMRLDLEEDGLAGDVPLQPRDVVFVPKTRTERVFLALEQYLMRNIPAATHLWGTHVIAPASPSAAGITTLPQEGPPVPQSVPEPVPKQPAGALP